MSFHVRPGGVRGEQWIVENVANGQWRKSVVGFAVLKRGGEKCSIGPENINSVTIIPRYTRDSLVRPRVHRDSPDV
jgi:hypothetical protein